MNGAERAVLEALPAIHFEELHEEERMGDSDGWEQYRHAVGLKPVPSFPELFESARRASDRQAALHLVKRLQFDEHTALDLRRILVKIRRLAAEYRLPSRVRHGLDSLENTLVATAGPLTESPAPPHILEAAKALQHYLANGLPPRRSRPNGGAPPMPYVKTARDWLSKFVDHDGATVLLKGLGISLSSGRPTNR